MSQERLRSIEARVESLSRLVREMQTQAGSETSSKGLLTTDCDSVQAGPDSNGEHIGYLSRQADGQVRYVAQTFWATMAEEVADLDELLEGQASALLGSSDCDATEDWIVNMPDTTTTFAGSNCDPWNTFDRQHSASAMPHAVNTNYYATDENIFLPSMPRPDHLMLPRTVAQDHHLLSQLPSKALADSLLDGYIQGCKLKNSSCHAHNQFN